MKQLNLAVNTHWSNTLIKKKREQQNQKEN